MQMPEMSQQTDELFVLAPGEVVVVLKYLAIYIYDVYGI